MARPRIMVEVCVTGLSGARTAAAAGADRLELCSGLPLGGLTPGAGFVAEVREAVSEPLIALIRPREGGFRYHDDDRRTLLREVESLGGLGVDGFAVGALTASGDLDRGVLTELRDAAGSRELCLHRAFDHVRDPQVALETAIELGFSRILTSGLAPSALEGENTIADLVRQADGRIEILPAGGISAETAPGLIARTGVRSVHLSASRWEPVAEGFRRPGISLGAGARPDEDRHLVTDPTRLEALLEVLNSREN